MGKFLKIAIFVILFLFLFFPSQLHSGYIYYKVQSKHEYYENTLNIDIDILVDALCYNETGYLPEEERIIARSYKNAIGYCQILPGTARDLLFGHEHVSDNALEGFLKNKAISILLSELMIYKCIEKNKNTVYKIAYCYNGGPSRPYGIPGINWYAKRVTKTYNEYIAESKQNNKKAIVSRF
ncbi:MAG: lytic transglycosylase domain-containing protein [Spirochaetota bacterium]|nr:lytic transglycosylase domain-containing protein [Spirochaetota bacterium]